jgi:TolA-binding protein
MGNFERAQQLAREAITAANRRVEPNNVYSAYAEGILADALLEMGDFKKAAYHYRSALKTYEHHSTSTR